MSNRKNGGMEVESIPPRNVLAGSPTALANWMRSWPALKPPDPALVSEAEDMSISVIAELAEDGEDFHIKPWLEPVREQLMAGLGAIVTGVRFRDLESACSLSWAKLSACAAADKLGYGRLMKRAMEERENRRRLERADEIDDRIKNGTEKHVVLRKGRNDELELIREKNDMLLTKALDVESRAAAAASTAPNMNINIGDQTTTTTVYNIEAPDYLRGPERPVHLIDADFSAPPPPPKDEGETGR